MHAATVDTSSWFLAHTVSRGTYHFGCTDGAATITTGQEELEVFPTEAELASRIDELKGAPGWYETNKPTAVEPTIPSNVT